MTTITIEQAYEKGWIAAAKWAKRDDLVADIGSQASSEASDLIEAFLAVNPLPSSDQWKAFTLAHPAHASQIADTALMLTFDEADFEADELDVELFNATRSAMLNAAHLTSFPESKE